MKNEKLIPSKYHTKYPHDSEREYVRLTNTVMKALRKIAVCLHRRKIISEAFYQEYH